MYSTEYYTLLTAHNPAAEQPYPDAYVQKEVFRGYASLAQPPLTGKWAESTG